MRVTLSRLQLLAYMTHMEANLLNTFSIMVSRHEYLGKKHSAFSGQLIDEFANSSTLGNLLKTGSSGIFEKINKNPLS
jgi:hypothetical protein